MAVGGAEGTLDPVLAFGLIGALGVGSQWLAWRFSMPAIVLMFAAGLVVGPGLGFLVPARDLGDLVQPMVTVAVAVILFEGGLTLRWDSLRGASTGVLRLVAIGAPVGWLLSTLALVYVAGLGWEAAAVFGGIMIVTGPTVIAPLLRSARLTRRPAALLQWEAIVNDPIGALAAVLAFEVVLVLRTAETAGSAILDLAVGIGVATALGILGGLGIAWAFRRGKVPEFMKVSVLFAAVLGVFAASDMVLHESGLLAVTIMGVVIANSELPAYDEMRRFKEHATVLLVSGVFVLLTADINLTLIEALDWRALLFLAAAILVVRPLTVGLALLGSGVSWRETALLALTGPRGVVLVAVAGLFGARLAEVGVADGERVAPLAFALVAITVLIHGFTLRPLARALGLSGGETPGTIIVGGSHWAVELGRALKEEGIPVLITDPNRARLNGARAAGLPTFYGDILSEAAERSIEIHNFATVIAATDNDAYNTLVATDLAPEFGRENVYQVGRETSDSARHALPTTLGGRAFGMNATFRDLTSRAWQGWTVHVTELTSDYTLEDWHQARPDSVLIGWISPAGEVRFTPHEAEVPPPPEARILTMRPPRTDEAAAVAAS